MPQVNCPNPDCGKSYRVSDESLGSRARCKKCGTTFELSLDNGDFQAETPGRSGAAETRQATKTDLPKQIGRFQIFGVLGSGGFGIVYRARDTVLKREVALKVPNLAGIDDDEKVNELATRFLREAEAVAQLHHPNIVPIFDTGNDGTDLYQASKLIEGTTLKQAFQQESIDRAQTVTIVRQLADALAYAHEQGIVHRDVKPANVMLDSKQHPYLMDFGLARFEETQGELTQDASLLGTPLYMSPEQASREKTHKVGPASDQYSLGVVLYELLTGKKPFEGAPQLVLHSILTKEPESPRSIKSDLPRDLETICQKAMAKEPGRRYADCSALVKDLRHWQEDEPIHARRVGPAERLFRWCRRNPAVAGLLCAVATVLVVGVLVSNMFALSARRNAVIAATNEGLANQRTEEAERERKRAADEKERAEEQLARSEQLLYNSRIISVQQAIGLFEYDSALSHLNACQENLREWEYNYLYNSLH